MRIPLFRIWYSTTYTTLLIILLLLLAIVPGDTIYQSIKSRDFKKLFVVGGVYLLTALIVLLVYSTRIYTNRTVLQAIPKGYVPVEEGEVGKGVRRMIVKHLRRSAVIAWDCRPRDVRGEAGEEEERHGDDDAGEGAERPGTADREKMKVTKKKSHHHHLPDATIIPINHHAPSWGHIAHPGWASPSSPDLPDLQYRSVICELPNLIEAKAVSLAPPDPALSQSALQYHDATAPPLPDAQIVALLQRPRAMGLRAYLARLAAFGLLNPPSLAQTFLAQYEHARFSTAALTEPEFRALMAVFADLLSSMTALDAAAVADARAHSIDADYDADTRSLAPTESSTSSVARGTRFRTPQLERHPSSTSSYTGSDSGDGTHSPQTLRTAPSRQRHRTPVLATPRTPSVRSLEDTGSVRRHEVLQRSPDTILPNSSESSSEASSLRSARSVIRLRLSPRLGELPYQYRDEG